MHRSSFTAPLPCTSLLLTGGLLQHTAAPHSSAFSTVLHSMQENQLMNISSMARTFQIISTRTLHHPTTLPPNHLLYDSSCIGWFGRRHSKTTQLRYPFEIEAVGSLFNDYLPSLVQDNGCYLGHCAGFSHFHLKLLALIRA